MQDDSDAILDDLLCRWAQWARAVQIGTGYPRRALVVGDCKISRQYDDQNGALDTDLEHVRCKAVAFEVSCLPQPHYTAIHVEARRLVVGVDVFQSPRVPSEPTARAALIFEARAMLTARLRSAGVI